MRMINLKTKNGGGGSSSSGGGDRCRLLSRQFIRLTFGFTILSMTGNQYECEGRLIRGGGGNSVDRGSSMFHTIHQRQQHVHVHDNDSRLLVTSDEEDVDDDESSYIPMTDSELQQPNIIQIGIFAILQLMEPKKDHSLTNHLYSFLPYPEEDMIYSHDLRLIQGSKNELVEEDEDEEEDGDGQDGSTTTTTSTNYHLTIMLAMQPNEETTGEWVCTGAFECIIKKKGPPLDDDDDLSIVEWGKEVTCSEATIIIVQSEQELPQPHELSHAEEMAAKQQQQQQQQRPPPPPSNQSATTVQQGQQQEQSELNSSTSSSSSTSFSSSSTSSSPVVEQKVQQIQAKKLPTLPPSGSLYHPFARPSQQEEPTEPPPVPQPQDGPILGSFTPMTDMTEPDLLQIASFVLYTMIQSSSSTTTSSTEQQPQPQLTNAFYSFLPLSIEEIDENDYDEDDDGITVTSLYRPHVIKASKQQIVDTAGMNYNMTILIMKRRLTHTIPNDDEYCIGAFEISISTNNKNIENENEEEELKITKWKKEISCTDALILYHEEEVSVKEETKEDGENRF